MSQAKPARTNHDANEQRAVLDQTGVAEMLGCSKELVRQMVNRGEMPPPVRVGQRLIRWPRGLILRWINAGCPRFDDCDFVRSESNLPNEF